MPGNGYRGKKGIYEALKEAEVSSNSCHRQRGLPVSHSEPDCHSRFFCAFANSGLIPPRLSFLRANQKKAKYAKAACQTFPRRDRGAVSNEDEEKGEKRDCKDF